MSLSAVYRAALGAVAAFAGATRAHPASVGIPAAVFAGVGLVVGGPDVALGLAISTAGAAAFALVWSAR